MCPSLVHACSVAQSCLTLDNPMDCSPAGSSVHGVSQAEYWSGLPCPPPRDLPDPGIKPASPALAGRFFTTELPRRSPAHSLGLYFQQATLRDEIVSAAGIKEVLLTGCYKTEGSPNSVILSCDMTFFGCRCLSRPLCIALCKLRPQTLLWTLLLW